VSLRAEIAVPLRHFELRAEVAVEAGRPLALVGPSGAGKSSVLRAVAGLLRPREGKVALDDEVWLDASRGIDLPPERRGCGLLFQDYALFPTMSAARNVAYGARGSRGERRAAALTLLERFGVAELAEAKPGTLSGGERQRVALARALAARPRALLLDEPLSALDSTTRRRALGELRTLLGELGAPVVLVTHSFDEAAVLADELAIVDRGEIVQRGDPTAISAAPASAFVADFTGASVLRGEAERAGDLTLVRLAGGGTVRSTDAARGPVAVCVYPWEVALAAATPRDDGAPTEGVRRLFRSAKQRTNASAADSIQNRVAAEVTAVTTVGNRARVALALPQPLVAEVTADSARRLGLREGTRVTAAWKASATRLVAG
jgi:molybdate transport system ATP-binding protein